MWQAYQLLSSSSFSPYYNDLLRDRPYPATAPAALSLLHASNFTATMRSYYAGTPFDLTQVKDVGSALPPPAHARQRTHAHAHSHSTTVYSSTPLPSPPPRALLPVPSPPPTAGPPATAKNLSLGPGSAASPRTALWSVTCCSCGAGCIMT